MTDCKHHRGAQIDRMAYWVCADCWNKLPERPKRYGPNPDATIGTAAGSVPLQMVVWQAAEAKPANGLPLSQFLACMVRRIMARTRPPMAEGDAYDAAIDMLRTFSDPFGHPDYEWTRAAAVDLVDEELAYWEEAGGNGS